MWHDRPSSPLLLYGFSQEVVECPGYWPSRVRACGFWFLPEQWQFSCYKCAETYAIMSSRLLEGKDEFCSAHTELQSFLNTTKLEQPVFISLSSVGSMGFLRNPGSLLRILQSLMNISTHRFILFSAGYEPLDAALWKYAQEASPGSEQFHSRRDAFSLFDGRLFCFSGSIPFRWLFTKCAAAIHHGGSGTTAAALHAGIPQVVCPFILDQFYWAERIFWLGVSPEPLKREYLLPDKDDDFCIIKAADMLAKAINCALEPDVKARAIVIANRIATEDGVSEAVRILKEEAVL